jgi:hypothetical protein
MNNANATLGTPFEHTFPPGSSSGDSLGISPKPRADSGNPLVREVGVSQPTRIPAGDGATSAGKVRTQA